MSLKHFQQRVESATELEALIGLPSELVIRKQLSELDEHMKSFIAESPFMLLGTAGTNGMCDVSPRGDLPSVARVLDSHTVVIAERPGNRRADSMRNIIETAESDCCFSCPAWEKRCALTAALVCSATKKPCQLWRSTANNRLWGSALKLKNATSNVQKR